MTEVRYRRLLWAYPRAYRRSHGAEIVTTLLDMAEAGRRPSAGQTLHLALCGLRQRFRLPGRRPLAYVAAILAAVTLAAFGAAAGTWLGWQTAASIPSDRELRALNAAMTGMPADAAVYHNVSAMKGPSTVVRADGTTSYAPERIRAALTSAGWRITSFDEGKGRTIVDLDKSLEGVHIPTAFVFYTATKGDLKLAGDGSVVTGGADRGMTGQAMYRADVWPREPAAVRPLTVVGAFAGAIAGWLLAAAFASRLRRSRRPHRRLATALSTAAFAAAFIPAHQLYRNAYQVMVYAHGSPFPYIVDRPTDQTPVLACTAIALLAVIATVIAARPRRKPTTVSG